MQQRKVFVHKLLHKSRGSHHGVAEMNPIRNREVAGSIPGLAQWVKDRALPWAMCRSHSKLGSSVAVAVMQAGSCSSKSTPSLATSICRGCGPKKQKNKKTKKQKKTFCADLTLFPSSRVSEVEWLGKSQFLERLKQFPLAYSKHGKTMVSPHPPLWMVPFY